MSLSKKPKYTFKKIRPIILQLILILFLAGAAYVTAGTISRKLPSIFPSPTPTPTATPIPTPTPTPTPTATPTPTPPPRVLLQLWKGSYYCLSSKAGEVKVLSDQFAASAYKYQACLDEKQNPLPNEFRSCLSSCHDRACSDACATTYNNRLRSSESECETSSFEGNIQDRFTSARNSYCRPQ